MNTIQFLMAILNWLQADPSHVIVAASAIAAVTPTPAPGTAWGKAYKALEILALNVIHAKETGVTPAQIDAQIIAILERQQTAQIPAPPAAPTPAAAAPAVPHVTPQ